MKYKIGDIVRIVKWECDDAPEDGTQYAINERVKFKITNIENDNEYPYLLTPLDDLYNDEYERATDDNFENYICHSAGDTFTHFKDSEIELVGVRWEEFL